MTVTDPEDGPIDCSRVEVTFVLGHDSHGHARGDRQRLLRDAADQRRGRLARRQRLRRRQRLVHRPRRRTRRAGTDHSGPGARSCRRRQEVEFAVDQSGTNTSPTADTGGGLQRGGLSNGDWIALNGTYNLVNIDSLTFRTSGSGGRHRLGRGPPRRRRRAAAHHGDDRGHRRTRPRTRARPSRSPTRAARTGSTWCSARRPAGRGTTSSTSTGSSSAGRG